MAVLEKTRLLIWLLAAWFAVPVPTQSAATADSVGFYAGTFDPPSRSQLKMIHCVLGNLPSHRACEEFGKSISRLVVVVLEDIEKDTSASVRERVLMLKQALKRYDDQVDVVASTTAQAEERKQALLNDASTERLFQIVPGDAYERAKVAPDNGNAKVAWLVFPLERSGDAWTRGSGEDLVGNPGVRAVVETLGLYREVSPDLADLQRSLFEEGWKDFLNDLKLSCPLVINDKACAGLASRWNAVSIVSADEFKETGDWKKPSLPMPLVYRKSQSEDRWAEKFVTAALQFVHDPEDHNKLKIVADDMAARVLQGYPYGRLPHLRSVTIRETLSVPKNLTVRKKPVTCSTLGGLYHADMDQYLADRFPRAFSTFLKKEVGRYSNLPVELYVHNHPLEAAYAFHRRDGYSSFHFLQTRRGQLHRNIYLAMKTQPRAYRLVLTSVRGADRRANVLCQMQRTGIFANYYAVESSQEQPLFVLNSEGQSLSLNPKDIVLFGFKGNWTRRLTARGWQRQPLVQDGLDIDLFTHPTMSHKLVVARNVYGDDGNIILDTFYRKGMRRVIYLGTAGAVADYRIGDVVIPNEFTDRHHNIVPFENNRARAYQSELAPLVKVYANKKQGWVQSLFDETRDLLLEWRAKSVVSVDIEGLHLASFAKTHADLQMGALFVVSDETLGDLTIDETMALRGLIDQSVDKVMSVLFPKVANPQ